MTPRSTRVTVLFVTLAAVAALTIAMRVHAAPATPQQDILPALLTEVKGLRAAMEQMAAAGPRVQLALGRLQLQEQRINTMIRRLESVRDGRTQAERELEQRQAQVKMFGQRNPNDPNYYEPPFIVDMAKADIARLTADIQRLTTEEADLSGQISAEQGRWTSINQQLEELERGLGRR